MEQPTNLSPQTMYPMLFELDAEWDKRPLPSDSSHTNSPQSPPSDTILIKDEPDLTIPLGWNASSGIPSSASGTRAIPDFASGPRFAPAAPATSAVASVKFAPTSTTISPDLLSSPGMHWNDFSQTYDFDPSHTRNASYDGSDMYFSNGDGSNPWSNWTHDAHDQEQCGDHADEMPSTPVDAFAVDFNLYSHSNESDVSFIQHSTKMELLSPFTSMVLESPPIGHQACFVPSQGMNAPYTSVAVHNPSESPSLYLTPSPPSIPIGMNTSPYFTGRGSTPSPPAPTAALPMALMVNAASALHPGIRNNISAIPTLSSSLPSHFTSSSIPLPHSGSRSPPNSHTRLSPPAHGMRSRNRAKSDASHTDKLPYLHPPKHSSRRSTGNGGSAATPGNEANPLKPPKQSLSTWQIFFTDWIARQDAAGGRKLNVAQAAKEAGKEYKLLSDKDKEPYARRAAEAKADRQQALTNWHSSLTPSLIALENRYRTAQRKLGLSRRSNLKDPNAPKKPLSAYFMFLKAVREDDGWSTRVFEGERETTRQSVMAAAKWREMSDDDKRPFLARAEQEKLEYEAARKEYEDSFNPDDDGGHDVSGSGDSSPGASHSKRRPRANSAGSSAMAFRLDDMTSPHATSYPSNGMGYFSTSSLGTNASGSIPIHIPKRRQRSDSTPSPTTHYSGSTFSGSP